MNELEPIVIVGSVYDVELRTLAEGKYDPSHHPHKNKRYFPQEYKFLEQWK